MRLLQLLQCRWSRVARDVSPFFSLVARPFSSVLTSEFFSVGRHHCANQDHDVSLVGSAWSRERSSGSARYRRDDDCNGPSGSGWKSGGVPRCDSGIAGIILKFGVLSVIWFPTMLARGSAILGSGECSCESRNNHLISLNDGAFGEDFVGLLFLFAVLFFEEYILCCI